jgi:hypothetical protein
LVNTAVKAAQASWSDEFLVGNDSFTSKYCHGNNSSFRAKVAAFGFADDRRNCDLLSNQLTNKLTLILLAETEC